MMGERVLKVVFEPEIPRLGGSLEYGARVRAEGLTSGVVEGVVTPGMECGGLFDELGLDWHAALNEAATRGANGESGVIEIDDSGWLPW
jgi:hypothetical protein